MRTVTDLYAFTVDANSALRSLSRVDVVSISDASELHTASVFRVGEAMMETAYKL